MSVYQALRSRCRVLAAVDTQLYRISHRILKGCFPSVTANPRISVVASAFNKERTVAVFIEALLGQSFPYDYELVFIDDASHDRTPLILREYADRLYRYRKLALERPGGLPYPEVFLSVQKMNRGQCAARNLGIDVARSEIVVVLDADCIPNKDFLLAHYRAYQDPDIDAAFGPIDLEAHGKDPMSVVRAYEAHPAQVLRDMVLQDPYEPRSFLNCIPRNFSIRKKRIQESPYDTAFSYQSSDPDSGYGWEDVDLGMRLYRRGARFAFVREAFAVHMTHEPAVRAADQPLRSLRNFRRLHEKHPELKQIARLWTARTYGRICEWLKETGNSGGEDKAHVDAMLADVFPDRYQIPVRKRLTILSMYADAEYQYELARLPHDFVFMRGAPENGAPWDYRRRPLPLNVRFARREKVDLDSFDLAILPLDTCSPDMMQLLEKRLIPLIALYLGNVPSGGEHRRRTDVVRDHPVVFTSHGALEQCMCAHSYVIWPGIDPQQYAPCTHYRSIVTVVPVGNQFSEEEHAGYRRAVRNLSAECVHREAERYSRSPFRQGRTSDDRAYHAYRDYVDFLRRHTIYFNPTPRGCMTIPTIEAMMCGLAVVSVRSVDLEQVITHGVNGFLCDRESDCRAYLEALFFKEIDPRAIGDRARTTALDLFSYDRFLSQWQDLIDRMLGVSAPETARQQKPSSTSVKRNSCN